MCREFRYLSDRDLCANAHVSIRVEFFIGERGNTEGRGQAFGDGERKVRHDDLIPRTDCKVNLNRF